VPNENAETLFKDWLVEHRGAVLKVARAYTLTAEDGRDLAQEILLQVWRSLPQFRGRASATTWCYRVALNTALAWHRKERRRQTRQQPLLDGENLPASGDIPREAAQRDLVERLYDAIRRLPGAEAALVLLHLDGLSYRQMAEVLGISEGNAGVKLNRAKKALGELMREEPHDHP
jgi:RNA polymerase sigma-70 factor (ECF subfamily)